MPLTYVVGQDVGISATVLADTGLPVTSDVVVTVTVTDPSGTVTHPAAGTSGYGLWSAVVPSVAVAGIWLWRMDATGPGISGSWAAEGQWQVQAQGLEQIVDLPSVKAHLNIRAEDETHDDELLPYIYAAGEQARHVCGPILPEQHTQYFDGGGPAIVPDWRPIASVLSVTEYYGLYGFAITEQPLGGQTDAFAFTVDYSTGQLMRRTFGGQAARWAIGDKNIKVVYTAGLGAVSWSVRLGALELIRHLYQLTQQSGRPKFGGASLDSDGSVVPSGFALPNRVLQLWQSDRRGPGIA